MILRVGDEEATRELGKKDKEEGTTQVDSVSLCCPGWSAVAIHRCHQRAMKPQTPVALSDPLVSASRVASTTDKVLICHQAEVQRYNQSSLQSQPPRLKQSSHFSLPTSWDHRFTSPHPESLCYGSSSVETTCNKIQVYDSLISKHVRIIYKEPRIVVKTPKLNILTTRGREDGRKRAECAPRSSKMPDL
ncbi:uncharacterized protein LOC100937467 isoform X2 [Pongo abelii]|uniref:uncharacterized protein LOC100937467 isoform X2 n=1 Tax=Pongo abelii TaxID=9601 RepID=UPI0023E7D7B7|nr:uncharacterized protein LOC100937467 isoform X2 [Pongo abelii]